MLTSKKLKNNQIELDHLLEDLLQIPMRILKLSFQVPQKLLKNSKLILKPLKHL